MVRVDRALKAAAAPPEVRDPFRQSVEFIPLWVKIGVAFALGVGTTIGYKRIVVTVAEKDYFYIQGEVHKPGTYELRPGMTLLQAIAVAEGLTDWADRKDIALNRTVGDRRVRQTVNMKNVERQKEPDVELAGGDIIIVARRFL